MRRISPERTRCSCVSTVRWKKGKASMDFSFSTMIFECEYIYIYIYVNMLSFIHNLYSFLNLACCWFHTPWAKTMAELCSNLRLDLCKLHVFIFFHLLLPCNVNVQNNVHHHVSSTIEVFAHKYKVFITIWA